MIRFRFSSALLVALISACAANHERDAEDASVVDSFVVDGFVPDAGSDLATPDAEVPDPAFELLALTHRTDTLQIDSIVGDAVTNLFTLPREASRRYELTVLDGGRYAVVNYWEHHECLDVDGEDVGGEEPHDVSVLDLETHTVRSIDVRAAALSASAADSSAHLYTRPWRFRRDHGAMIVGVDRDPEASVIDFVHIDLQDGTATLLELPPDEICWPQELASLSPRMPIRCAALLGSTHSYVVNLESNHYEAVLGLEAGEQILAYVGDGERAMLTATGYTHLRVRAMDGAVLHERNEASGGYSTGLINSRYLRMLDSMDDGLDFWLWDTTTGDRIDVQDCDDGGTAYAYQSWSPSGAFMALVSCAEDQLLVRREGEVVASYAWLLNKIPNRAFDASSRRMLVALNVMTRVEDSTFVDHIGTYQYLDLQTLAMHEVPRPGLLDDTTLHWRFSTQSYVELE